MAFDPVNDPDAYRRSLLAALGDQDPAVVLAAGPDAARGLVVAAGELLRRSPEPGEWSVLECIAHLADSELVAAARLRWIAVEEDPDVLLSAFEANRRWNLAFWERLPVADRARYGVHRERGPESIDLLVRLQAGHDVVHLGQAQRALDTARQADPG